MYADVENSGSKSSTFPVKSNCFGTGCASSSSTNVVHNMDDEVQVPCNDRSLTKSPPPTPVDLLRITGQAINDGKLTKLPVNLKLNGIVQLDEGPLDLSVSRRDAVAQHRRSGADNKPEVISASSLLLSPKSQTLTSGSLARLVKRFGKTPTSTSTSGAPSVVGSGGDVGRCAGRVSDDESFVETSSRHRSVTVPQSTRLLSPSLTSGNLLNSSHRPATTFSSPPPSRWRRDSFWASGGWLAASSASLIDSRKRPQPEVASDSVSADAQSIKLNRKLFSDHRKSSHRSSTRLRCDRKLLSSGHLGSSNHQQETSAVSCVDGGVTTQVKHSIPTSPKMLRTDDSQDTATLTSEAADTERKGRHEADSGDVLAATPIPVRSNLTSLRCGSCGAHFESLYCLTVHLEETGHKPASDVAILPSPSPATSPSSTDRKPTVASPAVSAATPPMSAPHRLVRGQDVWLARGVEQTDRILRCIQCNAPARSLAELTLHMVHTKHYINIVGPTTSNTSSVVGCDTPHRVSLPSPTTLRDKSADAVALKTKNGLRTASSDKGHGLISTKTRGRYHFNSYAGVADDDQSISQQSCVFLHSSAVREHDTNKNANKGTNKTTNSVRHGRTTATGSNDALVDGKARTTGRGAAFSVRNLIASDMDSDSTYSSAVGLRLPLSSSSTSPPSHSRDGRSMTSSVGPEVTSSSDERRSPATVADHGVISA